MTEIRQEGDGWSLPTFLLWQIFLAVGFAPLEFFYLLREWSGVVTQDALVNSSLFLFIALVIYFSLFVGRQCLKNGLGALATHARMAQAVIVAILAFIPLPLEMTVSFLKHSVLGQPLPIMVSGLALGFTGVIKVFCWSYVFSLLFRHYVLGASDVFARMYTPFSDEPPAAESGDTKNDV